MKKTISDERLVALYELHSSVHAVAREVGARPSSVHDRLRKLGIKCDGNGRKWTEKDTARLAREYSAYASSGRLADLAWLMRRSKQYICRKAKALGLTKQGRPKVWLSVWHHMDRDAASKIFAHFKRSSLGLGNYCRKMEYDDLGFSKAMKRFFPDEWEHVIESKSPRTSWYRLGRQVEYAVRDDLKSRGYPVVLRSPRSGGPADIVAVAKTGVLLVQCKRSLAIPKSEWNSLFELACESGSIPLLAGRPTGRGIVYYRILSPKDGSRRVQPMERYEP